MKYTHCRFKIKKVFYKWLNYKIDDHTYDPPRTAEFPFGDEHFSNVHMLDNDTNKLHCNDETEIDLTKLRGKCPMQEPEGGVMVSIIVIRFISGLNLK